MTMKTYTHVSICNGSKWFSYSIMFHTEPHSDDAANPDAIEEVKEIDELIQALDQLVLLSEYTPNWGVSPEEGSLHVNARQL